jgi:hypothetical protein
VNNFGDELSVHSGNGVASLLVFHNKAPHLLKLFDDNDDIDVTPNAKTIRQECYKDQLSDT